MKRCLTTACLVAVALGAPTHVPHSVQTGKKPATKVLEEKAPVEQVEQKVEATMLHAALSKDQEEKLEKDVSEVEKMRKALVKAEKSETTAVKQAVTAKVEEKKVAVTAKVTAKVEEKKAAVTAKVEEKKAAVTAKVEEKKAAVTAKVEEKKAAVTAKVEEKKAPAKKAVPKTELKAKEAKAVHTTPVAHKTHETPKPHEAPQSAAAKMGERMAKAEAQGEKMAVEKMSSTNHKKTASTKSNLRRIPVMRPRNFAKTVAQWEAVNPTGLAHASRVHVSHPHIAALPVVKALPWVSTTQAPASTNSLAPVAVNLGAQKKVDGDAARPEVIAKFTESAQASAERAQHHLEEAKKAFAKTSANADQIHETGKKIEKTAGTIKYLYSTPKPPAPATTAAPAPPKQKSAAAPRSLIIAASVLALGAAAWAC